MTREAAVARVRKVMDAEYAEYGDGEMESVLEQLDRALGCPTGFVADLIFWPEDGLEPTADGVVEKALAYRPFAL